MKFEWQKGAGSLSGILIIVVIVLIMLASGGWSGSGASGGQGGFSSSWTPGKSLSSGDSLSGRSSSGSSEVGIGVGNAAYSYQPYEEYITLENRGREPVNITGWQLKNGKDKRPYYTGSTLQRFSADVALISQAALVLSPSGYSPAQDVVLKTDERAIVTTGSFGVRSPYAITSFKENMCTGYLEELPDYAFTPSLTRNCPDPENEPGFENLDTECRRVVERLGRCETPEIGERIRNEGYCENCFEGKILSSYCRAFIKEHFSYKGCLAYHQGDPNFSGKTWRIFLGRSWEMWAEEYESIELYDRNGALVNFQNY